MLYQYMSRIISQCTETTYIYIFAISTTLHNRTSFCCPIAVLESEPAIMGNVGFLLDAVTTSYYFNHQTGIISSR